MMMVLGNTVVRENNKIYGRVDKQIKKLSLRKLNALRYKTSDCKTAEIQTLSALRTLLEEKDKGCDCLLEYDRETIVNIIKRYL